MKNFRLYDILVRHQIYIEGYKNFNILKFRKELPQLAKNIKDQFAKLEYQNLDLMTKKELTVFINNVKLVNQKFFDLHNNDFLNELEKFTEKDFDINKALVVNFIAEDDGRITDKKEIDHIFQNEAKKENDNKIFPFTWVFDNKDLKIYNAIKNSVIPAVGLTVAGYIASLGINSVKRIEQTINAGIANKQSASEILTSIIGTKDNNYKDGIFVSIDRANAAINNTVIQHTTSVLEASIQSIIYDKYQWISVIDNRTSDICRYRNLRIFYYGKGPLPPAHPHCRSKIKPVVMGQVTPEESFYQWINRQPETVQKDILSKKRFKGLKDGTLQAADFPTYQETIPLNLENFASKLDIILT